jgi:hypothetical protein
MTMPSWAIKKVIGKMPLKFNPVKCNNQTEYGDLTFVMNGFEYTLPNDDWVEKVIDIDSNKLAQTINEAQVGPMSMGEDFFQELS